jgi:hypothetical protein
MDKKCLPLFIRERILCRFVGERYLYYKPFNIRINCEAKNLNLAKLDVSERKKA